MNLQKALPIGLLLVSLTLGPAAVSANYDAVVIKDHFPTSSGAWVIVPPAELNAYDDVWFISDVHGQLKTLAKYLHQAGLTDKADSEAEWNASNQLLVLVGDYIDGSDAGENGAQVLAFLSRLVKEAPQKGSKVIALMGNHEAGLIADPSELRAETLTSFAKFLEVKKSDVTEALVRKSIPGEFARTRPLAAILGNWFVTHGGYLNTTAPDLKNYLGRLADAWNGKPSEKEGFEKLAGIFSSSLPPGDEKVAAKDLDLGALLSDHGWYENKHERVQVVLNSIGLGGMIVGHEPKLLAEEKAAHNNKGWLMKIDAGLKSGSAGTLVHCTPKKLKPSLTLKSPFTTEKGTPVCVQRRGTDESQPEEKIPTVGE